MNHKEFKERDAEQAIARERLACVAEEVEKYGFCPPKRLESRV